MNRAIRNFTDMLGLLSRGKFATRLNEEMTSTIEALEALPNEKGTATMTLTITFNYQAGRLDIRPAVKAKLPEGQAFADTPFWTLEGGLSTQHPSQSDMFVREVKEPDEFDKAGKREGNGG